MVITQSSDSSTAELRLGPGGSRWDFLHIFDSSNEQGSVGSTGWEIPTASGVSLGTKTALSLPKFLLSHSPG